MRESPIIQAMVKVAVSEQRTLRRAQAHAATRVNNHDAAVPNGVIRLPNANQVTSGALATQRGP